MMIYDIGIRYSYLNVVNIFAKWYLLTNTLLSQYTPMGMHTVRVVLWQGICSSNSECRASSRFYAKPVRDVVTGCKPRISPGCMGKWIIYIHHGLWWIQTKAQQNQVCISWDAFYVFSKDYSVYGLIQWETTLHCNVVSHWLNPYLDWSMEHCVVWSQELLRCILRLFEGLFCVWAKPVRDDITL